MYTVTNIDDNTKRSFNNDQELLNFAIEVYKENEDGQLYPSEIHFLPECISHAKEYLHEYCGDLELDETF